MRQILAGVLLSLMIHWRTAMFQPADPCDTYESINDTTLSIAYTATSIDNTTCKSLDRFKWYRYTGTDEGYLTDHCPQGLQCGSSSQVWFNDSLPSIEEEIVFKKICIHNGISCCAYANRIKVKNCTDFIVYLVIPVPKCSQFCFNANVDEASSQSRNDRNDVVPFWAWIIVGIVSLLIIIIVGLIVSFKIKGMNNNKITYGFEGVVFKSEQPSRTRFDSNKLTFNSDIYYS